MKIKSVVVYDINFLRYIARQKNKKQNLKSKRMYMADKILFRKKKLLNKIPKYKEVLRANLFNRLPTCYKF